jgi:signal transduction histidine kinase
LTSIENNINQLLSDSFALRVSNLTESISKTNEALQISREHQIKELIGKSLNQLALFYMIKGEHELSKKASAEAIEIFQELNDEIGLANAKYSIASIYYKTDNYQLGLINLLDCLTIYKKHNDYFNIARTQKSLGTIYEYIGDEKNAIKAYEDSIRSALEIKDRNLESNAYNPLSGIYLDQNNIDKAYEIISKAVVIKRATGDIRGLAFALYGRGKVFFKTKEYDKAEADFKEAIRIHLEMNERLGIGMCYYKIAKLYLDTSRHDLALKNINLALEVSTKFNIVIIRYKSYFILYELYKKENKIELALSYLEEYLKVKEQVINVQTTKIIENYELIKAMESIENKNMLERERAAIYEKTQRAEQLAKIKQDFLSTMSHEIRTPLNAVISISNLLKERQDPEENQLIASLNFASQNLLRIINDILDFTKLDAGKVRLEHKPYALDQLLVEIKNTYQPLANEKGLDVFLNIDTKIAKSYLFDSTKLTQIISNLISNAINYTSKGSVQINLKLLNRVDKRDLLRFEVQDTGVGIAEKDLTDIFDSFSQPQSITTRTQGGTGLGLAIVKKLVGLYGSEIHVSSKVNTGSTFYFELMLESTNITLFEINRDISKLEGKNVLIVDDNLINTMVAKKLLNKWGIIVHQAGNGSEAVEIANLQKFDFILMDIHMPIMDGYEACSIIRTTANKNTKTPIFALTADITADQVSSNISNFNGFLHKPIEIEKLKEALLS